MSTSPSADPYRPPALLTEEAAPSDRRRPGWFVTICVIAIALGGLGFLNGIYKVVEVTVGDPLALVMESPARDELEAPAMKFENAVREVTVRYRPALLLLALGRLALCACLVLGGMWCLMGKAAGRKLLVGTFAAALVFELIDSAVQVPISAALLEPFRDFGRAIDEQQATAGGPDAHLGETVFVGMLWVIVGVYYCCQAAKVLYYLGSLWYLRRSSLDRLFASPAAYS